LTELTKPLLNDKEKYDFILSEIPMGRLEVPEKIASNFLLWYPVYLARLLIKLSV